MWVKYALVLGVSLLVNCFAFYGFLSFSGNKEAVLHSADSALCDKTNTTEHHRRPAAERRGQADLMKTWKGQQTDTDDGPDRFTLSILRQGRLGNWMFQYSALYGLARQTNRIPVLTRQFRNLSAVFNLSATTDDGKGDRRIIYLEKDFRFPYDVGKTSRHIGKVSDHVMLSGFFQYFRYFHPVDEEIRRQFTFRRDIRRKTRRYLGALRSLYDDVILVGIHVRMGDLNTSYWIDRGFGPPPLSYFTNAINYFRTKFKSVHFVLCSDQIALLRRRLRGSDLTYVVGNGPETDMAILTSCDHVIIGNGTFSWWVGWLCKGITVVYDSMPEYLSVLYNATLGEYWPLDNDNNQYIGIGAGSL